MGDASSPPAPTTTTASSQTTTPIRILTHNIRFATDNPDETEELWPQRFPHLSSHFRYHTRAHFTPQATIVCMQEVLHEQLVDLHQKTFNDRGFFPTSNTNDSTNGDGDLPSINDDGANDWTYVGVGRNDGHQAGEYSPIFFRRSAWKLIHFETIWLNETGEVGKKGWDADSIRILTCAVLEAVFPTTTSPNTTGAGGVFRGRGKLVLAMNTHLDNNGAVSRRESAKLILRTAARLRERYNPSFTFLAGDLNSIPDDNAYRVLNAQGSGLVDTRRLLEHKNEDGKIYAMGNTHTFTGFPADPGAKGQETIDFIHLGTTMDGDGDGYDGHQHDNPTTAEQTREAKVLEKLKDMLQCYGVLPNRFDDQVWLSDHRGVVVDLLVTL